MKIIDLLVDEFILLCKKIYYFFKEKNYSFKSFVAGAIIVAGGYFMIKIHNQSQNSRLIKFEPAGLQMEKGEGLLKASELYRQKKYYLALKEFKNSKDTSDFVRFYMANSYMALESYDEAIKELTKIRHKGSYKQQAEWVYAQALYFSNNKENAIRILKEIADSKTNYFNNDAQKLLSSITKTDPNN